MPTVLSGVNRDMVIEYRQPNEQLLTAETLETFVIGAMDVHANTGTNDSSFHAPAIITQDKNILKLDFGILTSEVGSFSCFCF